MKVIGILLLISYFGWEIYVRCRPKEKNYPYYMKRGAGFEMYFHYKKALNTYEKARLLPDLTPIQQAHLELNCATCLLKQKDHNGAVPYLDRAFKQEVGAFFYPRQLKRALKGYMLAGEHEKARRLFEKFVKGSAGFGPYWKRLEQKHLLDTGIKTQLSGEREK